MPAKYRLIALDLDGTTLNARGEVSQATREAIARVVAGGTYVAFCTGRNHTESKGILKQVGHKPISIFVGGAQVVNTAENRPVFTVPMHPELAQGLTADLEGLGHAVLALQNTFATGLDYLVSAHLDIDHSTTVWLEFAKTAFARQKELASHAHTQTLRLSVVVPDKSGLEVSEMLEQKYAGKVIFHRITVAKYGVQVIEVFDPGVTKWTGIRYLADELRVSREEVIAVGDDVNDLPMLRQAGLAVAMANGHPEVKETAHRVIGHHNEEGLARFLEELAGEGALAAA